VDATRLKSIPVFADLGDAEIEAVAQLASEVSVPAGKELVREGDYSYDLLVIEDGTADVEREGRRLAALGPGDVVGELGVLAREQRNATVTATSPMMLVTLDRWDVKKLAKLAPTAVEHFQELVEKRREASAG
jgi:CRP/FNR family transcriptional regulator, cyclic AMP receptor protein